MLVRHRRNTVLHKDDMGKVSDLTRRPSDGGLDLQELPTSPASIPTPRTVSAASMISDATAQRLEEPNMPLSMQAAGMLPPLNATPIKACTTVPLETPNNADSASVLKEEHNLTFSEWLSNSGLEQFKQKLLSDEIGVGEESWRADVKELDMDACKQVGMSVVQVMFEQRGPIPLSSPTHTSFPSPFSFDCCALVMLYRRRSSYA